MLQVQGEIMYGLDLFSGIGGLTKALEGYVMPIAYCENDRYAASVLLSRIADGYLPFAPIWDDVKTLQVQMLPQTPDIIYGGFPCQDISIAGRRAGLGGERSGLFFEIVRIVGEVRPAFVFLENVPNIRSTGADVVVASLAANGYECRWITLSAADIGANHIRERWWLLAHASRVTKTREQEPRKELEVQTESRIDSEKKYVAYSKGRTRLGKAPRKTGHASFGSEDVAHADSVCGTTTGRTRTGRPEPINGGWWDIEPAVGRVVNGLPRRVDRLKCLGNAVVPAQAREAFERLMGLK